ncbi:MAG: DUF2975 domain-containing protein [Defluviitaleaceae bacterium]|nr:DUF2975 domain-containing protein [Defluviitaleaceae bacterium]
MRQDLFIRLLTVSLYGVLVAGIAITASLPWMLDFYLERGFGTTFSPDYRAFVLPFLMVVAVPCLWIVAEMIFMMRSIPKGPFVQRNVRALKRVGVLFLGLSAAFVFKCFFYLTALTLFCAFLFIGAGLFAFTFAALIRQSVEFREEIDLTI